MFGFLIFVVLIIIIVGISKNNKASRSANYEVSEGDIDFDSKDYIRGYYDGYQAHAKEVGSGKATAFPVMAQKVAAKHTAAVIEHQVPPSHVTAKPLNNIPDAKALAEEKAHRDLKNINTTLYVASFLLVAAAALFVGTALPESTKFIGIWMITILFYAGGLALHQTVEKLRPAAVAFAGTGLALLPFTGFAMYSFILPDASVCWFITSVISLAAFVFAATRLKNEVLSYISIAFGVSLVVSGAAVLQAGLIWYHVATIVFGSILTIIAIQKPNWLPDYFSRPIQTSNGWIVPLTIISSLLAFNDMSLTDYWIISMVSAFYYGAVAASSPEHREVSLFVTRLFASMAVILMAYDISESWIVFSFAFFFVGFLQSMISAVLLPRETASKDRVNDQNEIWLWLGLMAQVISPLFISNDISWAEVAVTQLLILIPVSFGLAYWFNRGSLSIFGTISLVIMPVILGGHIIKPALENQWMSLIFIVFSATSLAFLFAKNLTKRLPSFHPYFVLNFGLFIIEALYFTSNVEKGWGLAIWLIATALVSGLMYIEKQPWLSVIANGMILVSILRYVEPTLEYQFISLIFVAMAAISIVLLSVEDKISKSVSIRPFIVINFSLFIIEALSFTSGIDAGWGIALWSIATALVYGLMYLERQPWVSIVANAMIWILITRYMSPTIESYWIALIFMTLAMITIAILSVEKSIKTTMSIRPYLIANFVLFIIQSLALTMGMDIYWAFGLWAVATMSVYYLTYLELQPILSIVANGMMLISTIKLIDILEIDVLWQELALSWIAFAIFYSAYWALETIKKSEYGIYYWWSAVIVAGSINLFSLYNYNEPVAIAAGLGVAIVSLAIIIKGWMSEKLLYIDAGLILATIGLQRILGIVSPDVDILIYTHWWAAVAAQSSFIYYSFGRKDDSNNRAIIALIIVSMFSGMAALGMIGDSDLPYQMLFLIEHIFILIIGAVFSKKMYSVWGAVGAVLSVVWMIKDLTYLLLAIVAFSLIGAAIYALIKQSNNSK